MHFCSECGNMLYIKVSTSGENTLIYYCRKCGNEKVSIDEDNICVSKLYLTKKKNKIDNMVNEFTKLDPTLPRITNIKCPNDMCETNTEEDKSTEIIYIRYDDVNMKFLYLCSSCNHTWRFDKNKIELN
jgi:DNA-directed RNA polymerase subunit M/transcription elongation factor TFIIS